MSDKSPLVLTIDFGTQLLRTALFNKKGEWTEVSCHTTQVPDILIPDPIKARIKADFANSKIVKIDRSRNGKKYEVKLSNGLELEFDKKFNIIKVDD